VMARGTADRRPDSPVFLLLPGLIPPDAAKLTLVPRKFLEAIEIAQHDQYGATTLALLAWEAKRTEWERDGLRIIGRVQRKMKMFEAARETWESIHDILPDDIEANLQLATIYQRLGKLKPAEQACCRVLDKENPPAEPNDLAEALSQLARNQKTIWVENFQGLASEKERRQQAISDKRLVEAFDNYRKGFENDLNHYYSGINALGLLTAIVKLAEIESEEWSHSFPSQRRADNQLNDYQEQLDLLTGAVKLSLENARRKANDGRKPDEWVLPSEAQFYLLTSENVDYVRTCYQEAKNAGGQDFSVEAEARQVLIFKNLGLFTENCDAALEELGTYQTSLQLIDQAQLRGRIIIATGHRADAPGRPNPRFPNTPECIDKAKKWLKETILIEQAQTKGSLFAMAGAASGTDLLFLEICEELDISTKIVLPIPKDDYRRKSVADGGAVWIEKFNNLVDRNEPIILSDTDGLPTWIENLQNYNVFQRGNIWMMEYARLQPNTDATLIALWNERSGDGPGGTSDMVNLAREKGLKLCSENTNNLFDLPP
jgi:tetratricopeptide (TPR) repeat protein